MDESETMPAPFSQFPEKARAGKFSTAMILTLNGPGPARSVCWLGEIPAAYTIDLSAGVPDHGSDDAISYIETGGAPAVASVRHLFPARWEAPDNTAPLHWG
ncbi:uncharacterized protein VTP21DRAFT_2727 [Calcarisporiella thermophila]|uniref:uncharacterized protein n=1 Tax=Calcarisporiella thermophila TaxID=911321 RepID=UPI003742FF30